MAVVAQSQQLQVNAAYRSDNIVIVCAGFCSIGLCAVGQVGSFLIDIHMFEKVLIHEVIIALVVISGKSLVLIQIHGGYF